MLNPENGILMGLWVGTGHDSPMDIALASAAFTMMDAEEESKRAEEAENQDAWQNTDGWNP